MFLTTQVPFHTPQCTRTHTRTCTSTMSAATPQNSSPPLPHRYESANSSLGASVGPSPLSATATSSTPRPGLPCTRPNNRAPVRHDATRLTPRAAPDRQRTQPRHLRHRTQIQAPENPPPARRARNEAEGLAPARARRLPRARDGALEAADLGGFLPPFAVVEQFAAGAESARLCGVASGGS